MSRLYFSLKNALFFLTLTILPTFSIAQDPIHNSTTQISPCTLLSNINSTTITYSNVADCYKSIPFDLALANATLSTLFTLFNDYYIFRDASRIPSQTSPFNNDTVDILDQLGRLRNKQFTNDFQFHTDVRSALASLRDGHVSYEVDCYSAYSFSQPLLLYAPIINNTQSVRVYKDKLGRGFEDCIVFGVDNFDAFPYLRLQADRLVSLSHDPNVRLNALFASQRYDPNTGNIIDIPGAFASRKFLPESPFVDYLLKCPLSESPILLRDEWVVTKTNNNEFDDEESFLNNICRAEPTGLSKPTSTERPSPIWPLQSYLPSTATTHEPSKKHTVLKGPTSMPTPPPHRPSRTILPSHIAATSNHTSHNSSSISQDQHRLDKHEVHYHSKRQLPIVPSPSPVTPKPTSQPTAPSLPPSQQSLSAVKILSGTTTVFYQSLLKPSMGIMVVYSFSNSSSSEFDLILEGLKALHERNVTQLLIDLQSSDGDDIEFATQLTQMIFSNITSTQINLDVDARSNRSIQQLSQAIVMNRALGDDEDDTSRGPFDPRIFASINNPDDQYDDNTLFTNTTIINRYGRNATYTQPATLFITPLPSHFATAVAPFSWTNNPNRIRLITNGLCLSACGVAMHILTAVNGVHAYAIGGLYNTPLSMFSAAGGLSTTLEEIRQQYTSARIRSPMQDLQYKGQVRLSWAELYSLSGSALENTTSNRTERTLLEYNAEVYPSYFKLEINSELTRDRSALWLAVGDSAW